MKVLFTLICFLALNSVINAQNFTGQWKGEFVDNSTSFVGWGGSRCEYVLELESKGNKVKGYSYTYFSEDGKRYYTICRLEGIINPKSKFVEVKEVERTKTNVPNTIRNCFQVHKLTFFKAGSEEKLEGNWVPAPNQEGDCGFGTTSLSRRVLTRTVPKYNNSVARSGTAPKNKLPDLRDRNKIDKPVAKVPEPKKTIITPPVAKNNISIEKQKAETQSAPSLKKEPVPQEIIPDASLEKRNNNVVKTIELDNPTFKVDLYDNGDIDGDTISLIYNGKLLISHKRLSDKPLSLTLNSDNNDHVNELVMYAENLGEIPPNTALMVVTDGNNRYEVRITSDLQKSGTIKFVHKPKTPQ